jgi:hypothetical protein
MQGAVILRGFAAASLVLTVLGARSAAVADPPAALAQNGPCPAEMLRVQEFCVDRWEASLVDTKTGLPLSPYYPPQPTLLRRALELWRIERWQIGDVAARRMPLPEVPSHQLQTRFEPRAVSRPDVVPNGYLSYPLAKRACENAGKRLCTEKEWVLACKGGAQTLHPYGAAFARDKCNVFRMYHPAHLLHGLSFTGHTDPRLNLVFENGRDPLLRATGTTPGCASRWLGEAAYDMVGNLDEWIEDETGVFVGGFYARATSKGCEARIADHAPSYYDYSLGTRCCKDAR